MVWHGLPDNQAAIQAGLTVRALRDALATTHVRGFYRKALQVRRESESARNIQRLAEIRDKADNMPAVNAIRLLEQLGEDEHGNRRAAAMTSPGMVVVIEGVNARVDVTRDVTPKPDSSE
jgi:hypothetical protein